MTADLDIAVKPETPGSQCQSFVESADLATLCMIRRDPVAYQPTEARLAIEKFDRRQRIATQQIDRCVQARRSGTDDRDTQCGIFRRFHHVAARARAIASSALIARSEEHTSELQSLMRISYH